MKQLEQQNKEKEVLLQKFARLRDETGEMLKRMQDEFKLMEQKRKEMESQMFDKDQELIKKDATIKNLTQKQLNMHEQLKEAQNFREAHDDLKKQLENAVKEQAHISELRDSLQQDLLNSN